MIQINLAVTVAEAAAAVVVNFYFWKKIQITIVDERTLTRKRTQRQNDLRYYMQKRNTVVYT